MVGDRGRNIGVGEDRLTAKVDGRELAAHLRSPRAHAGRGARTEPAMRSVTKTRTAEVGKRDAGVAISSRHMGRLSSSEVDGRNEGSQ